MTPPKPGRNYKHYKGNDYLVVMLATHSETLEKMVVYQALYGENQVWVRPVEMFMGTVTVGAEVRPRFQMIE